MLFHSSLHTNLEAENIKKKKKKIRKFFFSQTPSPPPGCEVWKQDMDVSEERLQQPGLLGGCYTGTLHTCTYLFRFQRGHFVPVTRTQLAWKVF